MGPLLSRSIPPVSVPHIATLGPRETDSATVALQLTSDVSLVSSFRVALERACSSDIAALVPCGYVARTREGVRETWVDLHFEFSDRLRVEACWSQPTRPMCLAINNRQPARGTLVTHAATQWFAQRYAEDKQVTYVSNKPEAAALCAAGEFDMCIASADVVKAYPVLRIVRTFEPDMVWVLYTRRRARQTGSDGAGGQ